MTGSYSIDDLTGYISWEHFFFAWKVRPQTVEADELKAEALTLLEELRGQIAINYMLFPFDVCSEGDDIVIDKGLHIPFLRQQIPGEDGCCQCMSDYIKEYDDRIYVFATTVKQVNGTDGTEDTGDLYRSLLLQILSDRLAEAAAEHLQADVEKREGLPPSSIIRPAVGYPSIPDMSINFIIDELCGFSRIGVSLTESGMMRPHSSVSGFMILNPTAKYFSVGEISEEQLMDYASRRGFSIDKMRVFIYA